LIDFPDFDVEVRRFTNMRIRAISHDVTNVRILRYVGRAASVGLIWIAFIALNWSMIGVTNTEVGDFAANSLLVQEAKQLTLLDGHYSRFGFFHPGPALLYVLAFGEWAFFDLLGIAASSLGGQLMAVLLLSAAWLVAMFGLVRLIVRGFTSAVLLAVTFFFVLSLMSNQFVTSLWFPWMYALPFAVLVLALAIAIAGRAWAVPYAAVAGGFLMNGHASFLVIVPIVSVITLGWGALALRNVRGPRAPWVIGALVLAAFLLPLLIQTIRSFPGPLANYFFDDRGSTGLGLRAAFEFTAASWGGTGIAAMALFVLALLWVISRRSDVRDVAVRGLVISILAAWLGAYVYALFGVDSAENTYLITFFSVMPALFALTVLLAVLNQFESEHRSVPVIATLAISAVMLVIAMPTYGGGVYPADYNDEQIPVLADTLTSEPRVGRLVLNLDNSEDWSAVWSPIMGVAVELARRGDDVICIGTNWHIGFTEALRCTNAEISQGRALTVRPGTSLSPAVFEAGGLVFTAG
jgi:hypothetical protein